MKKLIIQVLLVSTKVIEQQSHDGRNLAELNIFLSCIMEAIRIESIKLMIKTTQLLIRCVKFYFYINTRAKKICKSIVKHLGKNVIYS